MRLLCLVLLLAASAALAGCSPRLNDEIIPTVADVNALATAQIQTANAPPEGWRGEVRFPRIDDHLTDLPGWRYVVTLEFDGVFSGTPRTTTADASAEVSFNQLGSARRVVVTTGGDMLGQTDPAAYEAVRLGPDAFLVQGSTCLTGAEADARTAADLTAGDLIGGISRAVPFGRQAVINGEQTWRYDFTTADLALPAVQLEPDGTLSAAGELWIAPEHNVVVRFYATLDVTRARVFGRALPVDGQVILRYDLYDIGTPFNITQPFGC